MGKKAMKAKKTMKKKKAKRVSKIAKGRGAKARVFRGSKAKTSGRLRKSSLIKNKHGKVVSKKAHAHGKKAYKNVAKFANAVKAARKALGIKGFVNWRKNIKRTSITQEGTKSLQKINLSFKINHYP